MKQGFIFGGSTGVSADEVARRRALADAYAQRLSAAPRNLGEGLTAIGNAIAFRGLTSRADDLEKRGTERANSKFAGLFGGSTQSLPAPDPVTDRQTSPVMTNDAVTSDDPLIKAVIQQESGGNPNAVSPVGARGLMQVMPNTGVDPGFGIKPLQNDTPGENVRFGTDYLNTMRKRYGGDLDRALVAYNWGPGNADKWNGDPSTLPAETRNYVKSIKSKLGNTAPAPPTLAADDPLTGDPEIMQLSEALADPFMPKAKRSILEQTLAMKVKQASPEYREELRRNRIREERDAARFGLDKAGFDATQSDRNADNAREDAKFEFEKSKPRTPLLAEYEAYRQDAKEAGEKPLSILEYQQATKARNGITVKPDGTVQIGGGGADGGFTKGQIEVDKTFAKDFYTPYMLGGAQDIEKNLSQLTEVVTALEKPDANLTGPLLSMLPDQVRATLNPQSLNVRDLVSEVAQRNLREILGGQFAQKEGEALIARAYNDTLPEDVNATRVRRLMKQITSAAEAKRDAIRHFEDNGTLKGWKGKLPRMSDFDPLAGEDGDKVGGGWKIEVVE